MECLLLDGQGLCALKTFPPPHLNPISDFLQEAGRQEVSSAAHLAAEALEDRA